MSDRLSEMCAEVESRLSELVEGRVEERLLDHVAGCDHCRDLRHGAESALAVVKDASADYRPKPRLAARVLAALDDAESEPAPEGESASASGKERVARKPGASAGFVRLARTRERAVLVLLACGALVASLFVALRERAPESAQAGGSAPFWRGKLEAVASAQGDGVEVCDPEGRNCRSLPPGSELPAGSRVATDARSRAELLLSDGSRLVLDRGTELVLLADAARHARLVRGALVAEVRRSPEAARIELPEGSLTVHGTKFSLRAEHGAATVDVAHGSVTLALSERQSVRIGAGETARIERGAPPVAGFSSGLARALSWSDETFASESTPPEGPRGLGELRAKKPGRDGELKGAVTLARHSVRVRIAGMLARTEVEEVFENHSDDVLEGIYRFPLPADAHIERLALEVDGKLEEGAFVDRERAAAIWRGAILNSAPKQPRPVEEIVWVPGPWRDPALLEWQRGGRFELRVFPIPKRGSRRVILAYTEVVKPTGAGSRRYTYPLAYDPSGSTRVDQFDVDIEVRGHDDRFGVRPAGYELTRAAPESGVRALRFSERRFAPNGDLAVEYALADRSSELVTFTYYDGRSGLGPSRSQTNGQAAADAVDRTPYVALALRPRLPRQTQSSERAFAIVVDASRSMLGEGYRRASELAVRLARELATDDRFTVLACGTECERLPGGLREPGADAAGEVARFLAGIEPESASDVVFSVARAAQELEREHGRERRIVYLGDGTATVGQIRPGSIERGVARALDGKATSVTSVAIGSSADPTTLAAMARGGRGVLVPYTPGRSVAEAAYELLAASSGHALTDIEVTLPDGLRAVAPARLDAVPAGGEGILLARMENLELAGDVVVRGKVLGRPFEQRYPVKLVASEARGNAFVPRLYAAARIADLEREGTADAKREAVALSSRFNVASRYTSLLVLESEAMFDAFGLDNRRTAPEFAADEEAESESAGGKLELDTPDDAGAFTAEGSARGLGRAKSSAGFGTSGAADAFAPSPAATAAPRPAPAPAKSRTADQARSESRREPLLLEEEPRRRMIPMRRVYRRRGEVITERLVPLAASPAALAAAERDVERDPDRRESTKKLHALALAAGDLERAAHVAERWLSRDPLDPEAITARADVLAGRGERERAVRVLEGLLDARPGDIAAQKRLARLARWAGRVELGCRHALALAELRQSDAALLAEAVRCARETGDPATAGELLANAAPETRSLAERLLERPPASEAELRGDLRLEAHWTGDADLDLALIDPDGHRVSWLGAPTRGIITARDVVLPGREGLALSGGKPGEYVIELVRAAGSERADGELTITVAGTTRRVAFSLSGVRRTVAVARISVRSELVPL